MPRSRLNDLTPADQQARVAALLAAINDGLLDQMKPPRPDRVSYNFIIRCRSLARWGDSVLQQAGLPGVPTWRSDEPIPAAWLAVKAADDGTPRPPVATAAPNLVLPPDFRTPRIANVVRHSDVEIRLFEAAAAWLGALEGLLVPGIADPSLRFAAPILWCWCAWLDELCATPIDYSGYPNLYRTEQLLCFPNTDGTVQLFSVAAGGTATYTIRQPASGCDWGPWTKVAERMEVLAVAPQDGGALQVFAIVWNGSSKGVHTCWQQGAGWSPTQQVAGMLTGGVKCYGATRSAGERMDLFAVSEQGELFNLWQNPDRATWGGWGYVGGAGITVPAITVTRVADDTVIVLHVGSDGQVWALTQHGNGWCRDPYPIQALGDRNNGVKYIASSWNSGGKLTVLAVHKTDLYVCFGNEADGHWEPFQRVAGNVRSQPCLLLAPDQCLRLFHTELDGGIPKTFCRRQQGPGSRAWSEPQHIPFKSGLDFMTAAVGVGGRVHLFGLIIDDDSDIFHAVESAPGSGTMLPVEAFY